MEDEVVQARESIQKTWEDIDKRIADKIKYLENNRAELKGQLEQMEQGRIYLDLIGKAKRAQKEEQEEQKRLNRPSGTREAAAPAKETQKPVGLDDFDEGGLTEEQKKIEIHVADAYKDRVFAREEEKKAEQDRDTSAAMQEFRAEDFDLDAEYFAWKEEINGAPPAYTPDAKKGLRDIFKRVK